MVDWRLGKYSLASKCQCYWEENVESFGDVTFLVGPDQHKVKGFKFPLVLTLPVFEAMLNVTWSSSRGQDELITPPHTDPIVFRNFLRLLLKHDVTKENLNSLNLSMTEICDIFYLSKEYLVQSLTETIERYIKKNTKVENVLEIYEKVRGTDEEYLELHTFKFMISKVSQVLKQAKFLTIPKELLFTILSESVHVGELSLFHGIVSWAEAQAVVGTEEDQTNSKKIVRQLVREFLPEIRLPLLTAEDFATHVLPTKFLDADEAATLSSHLVSSDGNRNDLRLQLSDDLSVRTLTRSGIRTVVLSDVVNHPVFDFTSDPSYVSISVTKSVKIIGLGFSGPLNSDYDYEVKVDVSPAEMPCNLRKTKWVTAKKGCPFVVKLDTPVTIDPHDNYYIDFSLQGPPTSSTADEDRNVEVTHDDVTFTFCHYRRQIVQILYSLA